MHTGSAWRRGSHVAAALPDTLAKKPVEHGLVTWLQSRVLSSTFRNFPAAADVLGEGQVEEGSGTWLASSATPGIA